MSVRTRVARRLAVLIAVITALAWAAAGAASGGSILVYTGNNAPLDEGGYSEFGLAAGKPLVTSAALPGDLSSFDCVVLPINRTPFSAEQKSQFGSYVAAGGRVIGLAENSNFPGAITTMNELSTSLGSSMQVHSDSIDGTLSGDHDEHRHAPLHGGRDDPLPRPYVAGEPGAAGSSLVRTVTGAQTFLAANVLGRGVFVLSGDSNAFSDNNAGGYTKADNDVLVKNLCGVIDRDKDGVGDRRGQLPRRRQRRPVRPRLRRRRRRLRSDLHARTAAA